MTELEIVLIITLTTITLMALHYLIVDYMYTRKSEELKRKEDLHYIQEDIRLMKRDIAELKMKDLQNLFIGKE